MTVSVGIDLGTTNSVISYVKRGRAEIIPMDGKNIFPSVLTIREGEITVGSQAKARLIMAPNSSVSSSKRDIGTDKVYKLEDVNTKQKVGEDKLEHFYFNVETIDMTPEDVAYHVLKSMKEKAETTLGEDIKSAVITVPAYFQSEQREATLNAAKRAGFNVMRLIPEPTAAALEYGLNQNKNQIIMVYDLGGGTFDISIMKVENNEFEVLAVEGDSYLGGDDFDEKISEKIYEKIVEDIGIDIQTKKDREHILAIQKIKEATEKAKIELSELEEVEIILPNLLDNYNLEFKITRNEYNSLIMPIIQRTIDKVHSALKLAKLTADDIDRLILVGGSTKSSIIKEVIKREIRDPYIAPNVDEVVACGAAIMASSLSVPDEDSYKYVPVLSKTEITVKEKTVFTYGIALVDSRTEKSFFKPVVERGSTLPTGGGVLGYTMNPYQEEVLFEVYRGESKNLYEDEYLGELNLPINQITKESVPVGAIFEIDENMIINLTSVEIPSGAEYRELIRNSERNNGKLDIEVIKDLVEKGRLRSREAKIDGSGLTNTRRDLRWD